MGYPLNRGEYGAELKYKITERISPLAAYLRHINGGSDHNSGGTYTEPINFIGAGAEAKLTKVFGLDLIFYLPIGNNNLEYSIGDNGVRILSSQMKIIIRLGFIFHIIVF